MKHEALHLLHRRTGLRYPNLISVRLLLQQWLQKMCPQCLQWCCWHPVTHQHPLDLAPAEISFGRKATNLANDNGEIRVAILAPEDSLVLDPARALVALLRLLEGLERPAADSKRRLHLASSGSPTKCSANEVRAAWTALPTTTPQQAQGCAIVTAAEYDGKHWSWYKLCYFHTCSQTNLYQHTSVGEGACADEAAT